MNEGVCARVAGALLPMWSDTGGGADGDGAGMGRIVEEVPFGLVSPMPMVAISGGGEEAG